MATPFQSTEPLSGMAPTPSYTESLHIYGLGDGLADTQGGLPMVYYASTATQQLGPEVAYAMIAAFVLMAEALPGWAMYKLDILDEVLLELLAVNIGTLMGLVILEIIPEIYALVANQLLIMELVSALFFAGILLPFFMEKFVRKGQGSKFRKLAHKAGYISKQGGRGEGPAARAAAMRAKRLAKSPPVAPTFTADSPIEIVLAPAPAPATTSNSHSSRHSITASNRQVEFHMDDNDKNVVVVHMAGAGTTGAIATDATQNETIALTHRPLTVLTSQPSAVGSQFNLLPSPVSSNGLASPSVKSPKQAKIEAAIASGQDVPLMVIMLFSDVIDNFVDGGVIASGWLTSSGVGLATTLAVFLDILPNLTSSYAVFIQAGASEAKALVLNMIAAFPLVVGAGTICAIASNPNVSTNQIKYLEPFAAGSFMYMCMADLIPIINNSWSNYTRATTQFLSFGLGVFMQTCVRLYAVSTGTST